MSSPDETDLQLVNLLQVDPRMPWTKVGHLLGISATTAANRWKRLTEDGLAWIVAYPRLDAWLTAAVDIDCRTESLPGVIAQLCANPMVVSVDECTGGRDILAWVLADDMPTLSSLVIDWIGQLSGVYGTRTSLVTEVVSGAESWRLNAVTRRQLSEAAPRCAAQAASTDKLDAFDAALARALALDGRASVASLALQLDAPSTTVTRRLARLRSGKLTMRCDMSPQVSGNLLECTWVTTVAPNHKARMGEFLKSESAIRESMWTTGLNNLRFSFGVSHPSRLAALEADIIRSLPGLAPSELLFHMRRHKSMGHLLDSQGCATGELVAPVFGGDGAGSA
ncbi:MAG: Lrp/AsnC family transcriptional regulator [Propionibacteriaceae bacterium]|jgi:DNA-binding Lrp family transcriptional regulator|nr:Lrp/AsnC family transcriptional regulator [Propionibacteriaceae bacterium]